MMMVMIMMTTTAVIRRPNMNSCLVPEEVASPVFCQPAEDAGNDALSHQLLQQDKSRLCRPLRHIRSRCTLRHAPLICAEFVECKDDGSDVTTPLVCRMNGWTEGGVGWTNGRRIIPSPSG